MGRTKANSWIVVDASTGHVCERASPTEIRTKIQGNPQGFTNVIGLGDEGASAGEREDEDKRRKKRGGAG